MIKWDKESTKIWFEDQKEYENYEYLGFKRKRGDPYLLISCSNIEHEPYWVNLHKLKNRKSHCKQCVNPEWTYESSKKYIEEHSEGYKLLDFYRKNNASWIKIKCPNPEHKAYEIEMKSFKYGLRCWECHYQKWTMEKIVKLFDKSNLTIIEEIVKHNYDYKYKCMDKNGYLYSINIDNLKINPNPSWIDTNPYALENIKLWVSRFRPNYEIIEEKYLGNNCRHKIKYIGDKNKLYKNSNLIYSPIMYNFLIFRSSHPSLKMSSHERKFMDFLEQEDLKYEFQYSFKDCKSINSLPFDFAIFDDEGCLKFLVEIMGGQHYKYVDVFHRNYENFQKQLNRDFIKLKYCINKEIKLLKIKYNNIDNDIKKLKEMKKKWILTEEA